MLRTLLAIYQKLQEPSFWVVRLLFYWHKQVWQPQEASWKMKIGLLQGIFYRGTGSILEFEGSVQHAHKGHPNLVT